MMSLRFRLPTSLRAKHKLDNSSIWTGFRQDQGKDYPWLSFLDSAQGKYYFLMFLNITFKGMICCCAWGNQHSWAVIILIKPYYTRSAAAAAPCMDGCVLHLGCHPEWNPFVENTFSASPICVTLDSASTFKSFPSFLSTDRKKIHT